jgi:hypothetical protein
LRRRGFDDPNSTATSDIISMKVSDKNIVLGLDRNMESAVLRTRRRSEWIEPEFG